MQNSKNILFVTQPFWPELVGSGPYVADIASAFSDAGHDVKVLTFRPHYPSALAFSAWSDGKYDVDYFKKVQIFRLAPSARIKGNLFERLINDLRFFFFIILDQKKPKAFVPDIVVSLVPSSFAALAARMICFKYRARHIVIVHDIESGLAQSLGLAGPQIVLNVLRFLERIALGGGAQVITLTSSMASHLRGNGLSGEVVEIPIWAELPEPESPESRQSRKPLTLMYSGNFGKKQDLEQLLPLFIRLQEVFPSIRIFVNGEGTERRNFELQVEALGLRNITFGDLVPRDELVKHLRSADVHLVPQALGTSSYLIPSKATSIMAAGRPFIALGSETGALADLARASGAGIVLPHDSIDLFEKTIQLFCVDSNLAKEMGEKGRTFASEAYEKKAIMNRYLQLVSV